MSQKSSTLRAVRSATPASRAAMRAAWEWMHTTPAAPAPERTAAPVRLSAPVAA